MNKQEVLFGLTLENLKHLTQEMGVPLFVAKQIAEWLYKHKKESIEEMTNLSQAIRMKLSERFVFGTAAPEAEAISSDGTRKYLFQTGTRSVEAAWIPEKNRNTLCLSTQVGCRRGCRFCLTARQGFQGNLTAGEILNQLWSLPERDSVSNIVFMGMGEPLDNLDALMDSLEILTSEWGFGISPKRITVSTIGILDGINRLLESSQCRLALSLHSPFPDERARLIPYERRNPVKKILEQFRRAELKNRRLTIEYLMIDGYNDTPRHSREVIRLLDGLDVRVNLIPFHPIADFSGIPSSQETMKTFQYALINRGIAASIRKSRGLDIGAACGLLSTQHNTTKTS